jgi:hypothetical protein
LLALIKFLDLIDFLTVSFPAPVLWFISYGDFLDLNPHLHAIVADGGFFEDNSFRVAPEIVGKNLEKAFQYEVLKMLKKEGKINDAIIENLLSWRHTGFHVYMNIRRFRPAGPACYACTGAL